MSRNRVLRLMGEMGLQGKTYRRKRRTTDSDHPFPRFANLVQNLEVVRPNQLWVSDITYIRLRSEFVYPAVIMDVFTRCVRGWHLGRSLDQELTLVALRRALVPHSPQIHHSDQGVQYPSSTVWVGMRWFSDTKQDGLQVVGTTRPGASTTSPRGRTEGGIATPTAWSTFPATPWRMVRSRYH